MFKDLRPDCKIAIKGYSLIIIYHVHIVYHLLFQNESLLILKLPALVKIIKLKHFPYDSCAHTDTHMVVTISLVYSALTELQTGQEFMLWLSAY